MSVSASEAVRHYQERERQAADAIDRYGALLQHLQKQLSAVRGEGARARRDLAVAYFPDLQDESFHLAEHLTGYRGFTRRDPRLAMAREKLTLEKTLARIQGDERYRRREYLVGPHGELTREREERRQLLEPWVLECRKFEDLDGFEALVEVKYDTPEFTESWWHSKYWHHWAAGDRICETLGMADFGDDVLPAYQKAATEREKWRGQVAEVDARIAEVHQLVQSHDHAVARIPELPEIYLDQSQQVLGEYLKGTDLALLEEWLKEESEQHRAIRMGLRKVAGLMAKERFLQELVQQGITPLLTDLKERRAKYARKQVKYARAKYRYQEIPPEHLDPKFGEKYGKLLVQRDKIETLVDRMVAYDQYERFDLQNDEDLWWLEFTGKRPSRLTPTLRSSFDQHPEARPIHDPRYVTNEEAEAVAQAAAAGITADDLGYLS
ncbi:MAG: hypothetical protein JRJ84_08145 [Deltaproteobacteria bacterium]|nr:hypothetical protein [Deltaproteobacteria bacterium]